jgi:hypothetical protein
MKLFLTFTCTVALAGLFAAPLSVMIVQQSEKIADNIRAFNKECASNRCIGAHREFDTLQFVGRAK